MDHRPIKINKWALRKQTGIKKLGKREVANSWTICDIEK